MSFRTTQRSIDFLAGKLEPHPKIGLTSINVLMVCLDNDGISGADLFDRMGMPKSTLWRALAFFTEVQEAGKAPGMGWLTRDESQTTGRGIIINITDEGKKIKHKLESL